MRKEADKKNIREQAAARVKTTLEQARRIHGAEPERLLEELLVHQAELEVQNEELRRAREAEEEFSRRYADLYHNAPVGYLILDPEGGVIEANHTAARLLGLDRQTLAGSAFSAGVAPGDVKIFYAHLRQVVRQGQRAACEVMLLRGDSPVYLRLESIPVREGSRAVCRTTLHDVTDRRRVEEELQKAQDELFRWQKYEALELLAGGIAHDFNNLLTAMLGNISLAQVYLDPADKARQKMDLAEKSALRAKELTQQLLSFSRRGVPVRKPYDTAALIREKADLPFKGTSCHSKFELPPDLWSVEVDAGQFGQVMQNLIINGAQAMPAGGTITIRAENLLLGDGDRTQLSPGRYVRIAVRDEGAGIPKEQLDKIFDPYFTTKEKGSGLGLAVAQAIVNKHGGRLEVDSQPRRGSTFSIYLPASAKAAPVTEREQEEIVPGRGRVLVMDDEEAVREVAVELMAHLGYQVAVAANGAEALDLYRESLNSGTPFDAVVLDLVVPGGMGGEETLGKLRRIDPGVKAVVSSGYSESPATRDYRAFGFCAALPKPYRLSDLSRVLHEVVTANCKQPRQRLDTASGPDGQLDET
jgi:PAS domain S-box-containing protein